MSASQTPSTSTDETRAGLEPKEFQKRLVLVTLAVLVLSVGGGTCLGYKIQQAEQYQKNRQQSSSSEAPATREAPGDEAPSRAR